MNDPRHPVQPAPTVPRPSPVGAPGLAPAAPRPPMAAPAAPQQRIAPAQPAGMPRVGAPAVARPGPAMHAPAKPQAAPAAARADDDAISLVEDADGGDDGAVSEAAGPSKIKFGAELGIKKHDWKRQLRQGG